MDKTRCAICGWYNVDKLCKNHKKRYMWDSSIQAYRLKKRSRGSRYTSEEYHKSEIKLTKMIECVYGINGVFTSVHPIWALTDKDVLYEFDIYIKSKSILIEYNGIQHYKYTDFFQRTKKSFMEQKKRDKKKYALAKKNGFSVVIFKYDEPMFKDYVVNKIEGYIK